MVQNVSCGMCFKLLSRPVSLSCGHDFCLECVVARLKKSNDNGVLCPLCAQPHIEVRLSNLEDFVNSELEAYISALDGGHFLGPNCQWCEDSNAVVQCTQCMSVYCHSCNEAVHKNSAKRNHLTGPLTDAYKSFFRRCVRPGHDTYKAEFFCVDCEELCCAYCLQVGPHKNHHQTSVISAAEEMRQQLPRDKEVLTYSRTRLENQASEFHRVTQQYNDSYDSIENIITERFSTFKQQLIQKELEVRNALSSLRDSGDMSICASRQALLHKLNEVNFSVLKFKSLENTGTDYEILENRSKVNACINSEAPAINGRGFQLVNIGEMLLTGLEVTLDLQSSESQSSPPGGPRNSTSMQLSVLNASRTPALPFIPLRLTFPVDDNVQATVEKDGVFLRCVARNGNGVQIGVRSRETLAAILNRNPRDNGLVSWQMKLENIKDTFVGVVEKSHNSASLPDGFYWKPASSNSLTDGSIGKISPNANRLPACRNGDIVRFVYNAASQTLTLYVNNKSYGDVVTSLGENILACMIFFPGESLTLLF